MNTWIAELRIALRTLARNRSFTLASVATLALGIAATTTMFTIVHSVLLQPLPYQNPSRLVNITATADGAPVPMAFAEYYDLRAQAKSYDLIIADKPVSGNLTGGDLPERVETRAVTGEFFSMLGVAPVIGRVFTPVEETPGFAEVGIISEGLWKRRFGGRTDVLGKKVRLDDDDYMIVGVMPATFAHPGAEPSRPVDFWVLTGFRGAPWPQVNRFWRVGGIMARLKPGVSVAQANQELLQLWQAWREQEPNAYPAKRNLALSVGSLQESIVGDSNRPLKLLFYAVGLVLLIACANVAGLQIARQSSRTHDIAVRLAIGASRWQVARPVVVESLLLACIGAAVGILLALAGIAFARSVAPPSLPRLSEVGIDFTVLIFVALIAAISGIVFGVVPALAATRVDFAQEFRSSGTVSVSGSRLRSAIVIGEIALALILLACAGLLLRTLNNLHNVSPGFRIDNVLTMEFMVPFPNDPSRGKYLSNETRIPFYNEILRQVRQTPGVATAAMTGALPIASPNQPTPVSAEGAANTNEADGLQVNVATVSSDYFATMGIPLLTGRDFTDADDGNHPLVAVISQSVAARLWPNTDVVGKRVKLGKPGSGAPLVLIIGVVGDIRARKIDEPPGGQIYGSFLQNPPRPADLVIKSQGDPRLLAEPIAKAVRDVEKDQPVYAVRTMTEILSSRIEQRQFVMSCLTTFAVLAVLLAAIGFYGLMSYMVSQRMRELAVRLALGAAPASLAGLIVGRGLILAGIGCAIGLVGAVAVSRMLVGFLFDVSPLDPISLTAAAIGTLLVGLLACVPPSRRAATVDPLSVLRSE